MPRLYPTPHSSQHSALRTQHSSQHSTLSTPHFLRTALCILFSSPIFPHYSVFRTQQGPSNSVGYQEITIQPGFGLFSVGFKGVGDKEFDIQNMECWQDGAKIELSSAKCVIQKMMLDGDGGYDSTKVYSWKKRSGKLGWFDADNNYLVDGYKVTLGDGEGVSINNKTDDPMQIRISGEVKLIPNSMLVHTGFSLMGNMTPVDIDIQKIKVYDAEDQLITSSSAKAVIQLMMTDGDGGYDSTKVYSWKKRSGKTGWFDSDNNYLENEYAVTIPAGMGFSFNNKSDDNEVLKFEVDYSK